MDNKEKILDVALNLFAVKGFDNTSTNLIAMQAGVSEGLIFRHFKSKEGLLKFIIKSGFLRLEKIFKEIVNEKDPEKFIAKVIDLPIKVINQEKKFWRLQYILKLQEKEKIKEEYQIADQNIFLPLSQRLEECFTQLKYTNPELEANILMVTVEGLAMQYLNNLDEESFQKIIHFFKTKYQIYHKEEK